MNRTRIALLLPLLTLAAACQAEKKPLTGFDKQPPGTLLLDSRSGSGALVVWPLFDLPSIPQKFRVRLNGQDTAVLTSQEGFYDYLTLDLEGWTQGLQSSVSGIPPAT